MYVELGKCLELVTSVTGKLTSSRSGGPDLLKCASEKTSMAISSRPFADPKEETGRWTEFCIPFPKLPGEGSNSFPGKKGMSYIRTDNIPLLVVMK